MAMADTVRIPWWQEPTRDQWYAYMAAWAGWTLDAFDFTAFLLIMAPIAKEFGVPVSEVAAVLTITLWLRLVGATASGWLADRIGRKTPLMISIVWYSICNFLAGLSPSFFLLFLFRALLGIGMGAEWPAGAALAMESWPARSRAFMGAVMQGSWGIGFLLSSLIYGLFYDVIGWRGLLMIGILPALLIIWIRLFVKEPEVWVENQRQQKLQGREVRTPLFSIFKPEMLGNTLTTCLMMASAFVIYYANYALFATHLQLDLKLSPALVALPIALANTAFLPVVDFLGLAGGMHRAALGDNHPGGTRGTDSVPVPADRQLHPDRHRICPAGNVCLRRHARSIPGLSLRTVSDRGARDGGRLLLPPGGNLGWADLATAHFICDNL